jgi:succinate dehydrogenase / fumarate reductase flavoprotein subunit
MLAVRGTRTVDQIHRELGLVMWDEVGMERDAAGLARAIARVRELRQAFWNDVRVLGDGDDLNPSLEKAGRVADFLEFAELLAQDALVREESCGGHFRSEHQTEDGEAKRDDARFSHVAAWEHAGEGRPALRHEEPLTFEAVRPSTRSYT